MGKFLERTPLEQDTLSPANVLAAHASDNEGHLCQTLKTCRWHSETCSSLTFVPGKDSSILKSTTKQIAAKKKKNHIVCSCVCLYVQCWQRPNPGIKMEKQDTFRCIFKTVSLLKPPLIHLVRINLPPDSSRGYLYPRFLCHIIFMCYVSTSPQN